MPETAVTVFDTEFRIVLSGGQALGRHGYDAESMVGRPVEDVLPTSMVPGVMQRLQEVLGGATVREDYTTFDQTREYHVVASPLRDADDRIIGVVQFSNDITERKAAERALLASYERLAVTFSQAPVAMALCGLDGTWLEVNDELATMLGRTPEQLRGTKTIDITHPDDIELSMNWLEEGRAGPRDDYAFEKRYVNPDGRSWRARVTVSRVKDSADNVSHLACHFVEIA